MFVEYLFQINPFTLFLVVSTFIFFIAKMTKKETNKVRPIYGKIPIEFVKIDESVNNEDTILVMSYNIMAYNFTKLQWYTYCSPEHLPPKYRSPRIVNEIEQLNADIISLQECDHDLFVDYYKPNLEELGYQCIHQGAMSNRSVTSIVAYKKNLFTREKWSNLELNEDLASLDESFLKHKEAIIVLLRHNKTNKQLLVVNTHLFWNPEFEYVKYGQISKILNHIEKNYNNLPIILCGDLNSTPNSNVMKYVYLKSPEFNSGFKGDSAKNKKFIELFWNEYRHNLMLRSAYDTYKTQFADDFAENHPDFTTYTSEFAGTIDYIIYSHDKLKVVELLNVPTNDAEVKGSKLPNSIFPSKHLKIASRFKFT